MVEPTQLVSTQIKPKFTTDGHFSHGRMTLSLNLRLPNLMDPKNPKAILWLKICTMAKSFPHEDFTIESKIGYINKEKV